MNRFRPFFIKENQKSSISESLLSLLKAGAFSISVAEHKSSLNLLSFFSLLDDKVLRGGVMCHSDASLIQMLGISSDLVIKKDCLDKRALAMANRIKDILKSDIGYACTKHSDSDFIYIGLGIATSQYQRSKVFKIMQDTQDDQSSDLYFAPLYFFLSNQRKEEV